MTTALSSKNKNKKTKKLAGTWCIVSSLVSGIKVGKDMKKLVIDMALSVNMMLKELSARLRLRSERKKRTIGGGYNN